MKQAGSSVTTALTAVLFLLSVAAPLWAATGEELIQEGIDQFGSGEFQTALLTFRDVVLDSSMEESHGSAYFWISRSYMAMDEPEKAQQNLEFFLSEYEGHPRYAEGLYQKGRLLHLQGEYEKSIRQLYRFIEEYPSNPYKANAYFWVGESLYALGHYDKAEAIFTLVVRDHPQSFKVEAARYRLSLVDLKRREEELLKLLKMSHEEYLKALEEFDRKARSYEQAIASYQRKLTAATADNDNELIDALNEEIEQKDSRIDSLEQENDQLKRQIEDGGGTPAPSASSSTAERERLLDLKSRALELKERYLQQLTDESGGQ